jgi:hypothetical protein
MRRLLICKMGRVSLHTTRLHGGFDASRCALYPYSEPFTFTSDQQTLMHKRAQAVPERFYRR